MQIDIAIEMEKMIKKINQSSKRNIFSNNVEKMLNVKFNELEKVKKLKKDVYEDWKMGDISREEYIEYKSSYEKDIIKIEENIKCLEEEKEKYKEQVLGDNIWIEKLKEKRNITKLTRDIIVELIDCIYVHESGDITIKFKFEDEYERILEYIKINEELTLEIRAI